MLNFSKPKIKTLDYAKTISQLKAQITQLKYDKELLRIFLHEIIEAHYRTVNQVENQKNFCQKCGCQEANQKYCLKYCRKCGNQVKHLWGISDDIQDYIAYCFSCIQKEVNHE